MIGLLIDDLRSVAQAKQQARNRYGGSASEVLEGVTQWDIARNLDEAQSYMLGTAYDVLLVDHDLGLPAGDGSQALRWLVERFLDDTLSVKDKLWLPDHVFCVSDNPPGAKNIEGWIADLNKLRVAVFEEPDA